MKRYFLLLFILASLNAELLGENTISNISNNPYMIFYFVNDDDILKEARFRYHIYDFNSKVM